MIEQGIDTYGAEFKRTSNDFHIRHLEQDNCVCSICHGTGAKIEFRYVTRNYESAKRKGKICDSLQAHGHSFWICPTCLTNLDEKSKKVKDLVKDLIKDGGGSMRITSDEQKEYFSGKLFDLMVARRLRPSALAADLDIHQHTLFRWLAGTSLPNNYGIIALCNYFDISKDELLGGVNNGRS